MKNINMVVKGTTLTITVDLSKEFGASASGKSTVIASTEGNQVIEGGVSVGVNVYRRKVV